LAFSKEHKQILVTQYEQWLNDNNAFFMLEYTKMTMKEINAIRTKAREFGGEVHVAKNTLLSLAMQNVGFNLDETLTGTTLVGFTIDNAPSLAKLFSDTTKDESFALKGGFLDGKVLSVASLKALADLPPLPVVRAQFLGLLSTPASKLVRTILEPAREIAAVIKAYSEERPAASEA